MRPVIVITLLLTFAAIHHPQPQARSVAKQRNSTTLPDLVVTGAVLINVEKGEFRVTVKNRGKGPAPDCQLRLTIMDRYGKQILKITDVEQPPLKANESATLNISAQIALASLKYIFVTDAMNHVPEANDKNNSYRGEVGNTERRERERGELSKVGNEMATQKKKAGRRQIRGLSNLALLLPTVCGRHRWLLSQPF